MIFGYHNFVTERICLRPAPKEGSPPPLQSIRRKKEGKKQKYNPTYGRRREKESDTQHRQDHRGNRQQDGTNINQVAIHAHTYGVYPEEIDGLKRDYEKLWGEVSKVLRELSELVAK